MAQEIGNLAVSLSIDSAKFEQSLSSIDRNLKAMGQEIRAVQSKGKSWGNSIGGLTSKQDALTRMLDGQGTKVERLRAAYEKSKAETGENSKATENLAIQLNRAQAEYNRTETELAQVSAALAKQEAELKRSQSGWQQMGEKMQDVGAKMQEVGGKMKDIGKEMSMKVTAPLVALGTIAAKVGSDFEAGMSQVAAISGATGDDLEALRDKAREMGATTQFSATQSAEALNYMALAGWDTTQMLGGIEGVMALAAASGEDLGRVSDIVTDGLSAFGLAAEDSARFADVLAAASANANTDVSGLGGAFEYVAPVAGALGYSIEDAALAIGLMSNNGIKGQKAGTALRTMMTNLAKPTAAMEKEMQKLGISLADSEGNMKTFDTIMRDLQGSFANLTEAEQAQAAATIFGKEAMSGALAIINTSAADYDKLSTAINGSEGAAQQMADVMNDNLQGRLKQMKSALEEAAISIFTALQPALEMLILLVQGLANWFNTLSPEIMVVITVIAGIAAAIGPVLVIMGTLISSVGSIIGVMGTMSTVVASAGGVIALIANPIGIAVAAIGTIIAAVVLAYNKLDWFRDGVNTIWEKIKEYTTIAFNFIKDTITKVVSSAVDFAKGILDKFKVFWDENGKAIMTIVKLYFTGIQKTIELVMGAIKGVFQVVWPIITGIIKTAWELIKTHVQVGIDLVLGIIRTVMKVLQGDWKGAWNTIKETAQNIWKNIQDFFRNVDLIQIGKDMILGLITGIKSMASAVVNSVKGVVNGAIEGAKNLLGIKSPSRVFLEIGDNTGQGLVDGINAKVKMVANAGKRLASATIQPLDSYSLPTSVTRSSGTNTGNSLSTTGNKGASGNGNEGPIIIKPAPIVLDGRVIGEAVFETVDQTMGSSSRLKNHMRGV